MLSLTNDAVSAIRTAISGSDDNISGLRLMVSSGGCSGLKYMLGLENAARDGDAVYEFEDVKVFIDAESQPFLDGLSIDFTSGLEGAGFVFNNPNAANKCGCGKSFSC